MKINPDYEGLKTVCNVFEDPEQAYNQIYTKVWNEGIYGASRIEIVDTIILELKINQSGSLKMASIDSLFDRISDVIELSDS